MTPYEAHEKREADMRRILVVNDDADVGPAIGLWLRHHGFCVSTADVFTLVMRGSKAIRLFHRRAPEASPDRNFRFGFSGRGPFGSRFSSSCGCAWRDVLSAQAVQARDRACDECLAAAGTHRRRHAALVAAAERAFDSHEIPGSAHGSAGICREAGRSGVQGDLWSGGKIGVG